MGSHRFSPLAPPSTVGDLFTRMPPRFGLRGDTYLWGELKDVLADTPLPDNQWDLRKILEGAWESATGTALTNTSTSFYVERFDPGHGMSAGQVMPSWWLQTGMDILIDRFCAFSGEQ
ncbi:hypothetical protein G7068_01135 [Leucobacter viscericola]|uniref:Uncharacterized protein n=1 Tax=Leucobacter viscericola TaxID=2714935 RepID=A0A6G7XBJ1_9MICO|nr:hypothetical protein [Leucobacter viscericola]QIK61964.1 hypothetical protein G7068_01135 [Leucobacter viscericola]